MFDKYKNFVRGVAINNVGKLGVILTTSSFITFLFFEMVTTLTGVRNAYVGLISYLGLPALFMIGLILIPFGWHSYKKQRGKTTSELLNEQFSEDELKEGKFGSRLWVTLGLLTLLNATFLFVASSRMLSFMDEAEFCGTACHDVMGPEWAAYQESPHARVACVECHVGEGIGALIDSKINGTRQMILASLNLYERPVPTPVHQLRPARETCEKCHWPEKFYGQRIKKSVKYMQDSLSTPLYTTLALKVDGGKIEQSYRGIHWHINPDIDINYGTADKNRLEMLWVEARHKNGKSNLYRNRQFDGMEMEAIEERTMDCVDCHNRATHIYEDPEKAVDARILTGEIDRSIPYIKKIGLKAILSNYNNYELADRAIESGVTGFYRDNMPGILRSKRREIAAAVTSLQKIFRRNVHPYMNVYWNTYLDHSGHRGDTGCFRCHNQNLVNEDNKPINHDCTTCHSILADDSPAAFYFLRTDLKKSPEKAKIEYLREEFLRTSSSQ